MEKSKDITILQEIDLDKLYKDRKYEKLLRMTRFICIISILLNIIFMVYRLGNLFVAYLGNAISFGDASLAVIISILHIVIVFYGIQSLRILKYKC